VVTQRARVAFAFCVVQFALIVMFVGAVGVGVVVLVWTLLMCLEGWLFVVSLVLRTRVLDKGGCLFIGKIWLRVCVRVQGCRIESVPLKRLLELAGYCKTRWSFVDGWLILEAF
jgi:hypothetical protein